MNWPDDADGGVFRKLQKLDFDFSVEHFVSFFLQFRQWPPWIDCLRAIGPEFFIYRIYEPEDIRAERADYKRDIGFVLVQKKTMVEYATIVILQEKLSQMLKPFQVRCGSWGVDAVDPQTGEKQFVSKLNH